MESSNTACSPSARVGKPSAPPPVKPPRSPNRPRNGTYSNIPQAQRPSALQLGLPQNNQEEEGKLTDVSKLVTRESPASWNVSPGINSSAPSPQEQLRGPPQTAYLPSPNGSFTVRDQTPHLKPTPSMPPLLRSAVSLPIQRPSATDVPPLFPPLFPPPRTSSRESPTLSQTEQQQKSPMSETTKELAVNMLRKIRSQPLVSMLQRQPSRSPSSTTGFFASSATGTANLSPASTPPRSPLSPRSPQLYASHSDQEVSKQGDSSSNGNSGGEGFSGRSSASRVKKSESKPPASTSTSSSPKVLLSPQPLKMPVMKNNACPSPKTPPSLVPSPAGSPLRTAPTNSRVNRPFPPPPPRHSPPASFMASASSFPMQSWDKDPSPDILDDTQTQEMLGEEPRSLQPTIKSRASEKSLRSTAATSKLPKPEAMMLWSDETETETETETTCDMCMGDGSRKLAKEDHTSRSGLVGHSVCPKCRGRGTIRC